MITGLVGVDEGMIAINGNDVTRMPMYRRARLGVGYLPQEASIFSWSHRGRKYPGRAGSSRTGPAEA